jgi:hypothetical protein
MELIGEVDGSFREGLWWTGEGTSSVSRRSSGQTPTEAADEDEAGFSRSNEVRGAGNSLACGLRGVLGDGVGGGRENGGCGVSGDATRGIVELPSIPVLEATLPLKLAALERCWRDTGVTLPSESRGWLYSSLVCCRSGFLPSSPGTKGQSAAFPCLNSESSNKSRGAVPIFSLSLVIAFANLRRWPASCRSTTWFSPEAGRLIAGAGSFEELLRILIALGVSTKLWGAIDGPLSTPCIAGVTIGSRSELS